MTGQLNDCIFDHKVRRSKRVDCLYNCTELIHWKTFEDFDAATEYLNIITEKLHLGDIRFVKMGNQNLTDLSFYWYNRAVIDAYKQAHFLTHFAQQ